LTLLAAVAACFVFLLLLTLLLMIRENASPSTLHWKGVLA